MNKYVNTHENVCAEFRSKFSAYMDCIIIKSIIRSQYARTMVEK